MRTVGVFFCGKNLECCFSGLLGRTGDIGLYAFAVNAFHHGTVCLKVVLEG